jgi:hypothetical protein
MSVLGSVVLVDIGSTMPLPVPFLPVPFLPLPLPLIVATAMDRATLPRGATGGVPLFI